MLTLAFRASARPAFDTSTPDGFFTNVANQVIQAETARWQAQDFAGFTNTFGATTISPFGLTNIPVYVNGTCVYASSIQRLLQVTANLYDATSTNPYPSVFRPTFYRDPISGNVFIKGYQLIASVTGLNDFVLSQPVDISLLASTNFSGPNNINVYGIPWIIGARKGLPSFNEFYMLNRVQVKRRLQVNRNTTNVFDSSKIYTTNQMYIMSITNTVGISFWNSSDSDYTGSGDLKVYASDVIRMVLTNEVYSNSQLAFYDFSANLASWPGSAWTSAPLDTPAPVPQSFIATNWSFGFLPESAYRVITGDFIPTSQNPPWETNVVNNYAFPQFGLITTNWIRAMILDGNHVIDYVQFSGPNRIRNISAELADPNYPNGSGVRYMWSTNAYGNNTSPVPAYGEVNQILVSKGVGPPPLGGAWSTVQVAPGLNNSAIQIAYFQGFWVPTWQYNNIRYTNTALSVIAPYTPIRTLYDYQLWQANDPLVHYLASDLNLNYPIQTGFLKTDTYPPTPNIVGLNLNQLSERYEPWGTKGLMAAFVNVDTNEFNLAYKDPLIYGSDYWNFPTNQTWNPNWLGRVHRGTPWQTIFLKAPNILGETVNQGGFLVNYGTNTWKVWTGASIASEAARTSPVNDWHLASLLTALLNTNASPVFISVNNPNPSAWAAQLDGLTAWTNSSPYATITLSSNSPAVIAIANAIQSARVSQPGQLFQDVGDVLATPELSAQSPFLNWNDPAQQQSGISDEAYEAIPSQVLAKLGMDSIGSLVPTSGTLTVRFTGGIGHQYALQSSADLIHWISFSTNSPVNGGFNFLLPTTQSASPRFYRSLLLQ